MAKTITWERALIRMGFVFEKRGDSLNFVRENPQNLQLLERMLETLGVQNHYYRFAFTPPTPEVEEERLIHAFWEGRGGREDFPGEVEAIILHALDPYIAGIVRWCAAIGIRTVLSCDGHGKRPATLHFERNDQQSATILDTCLALISNGRWKFRYHYMSPVGRLMRRYSSAEIRNFAGIREKRYEQEWLLDVAEALHQNQDMLRAWVRQMSDQMKSVNAMDGAMVQ